MSSAQRWTAGEVESLFRKTFVDLLFQAQQVHRENFNPNLIQVSTLLSIKTGSCPEDCKYCSQSSRYRTDLERRKLISLEEVVEAARAARDSGSTRFCMGAAWRNPNDRDIPLLKQMIREVKNLGLETCMTLGILSESQVQELSEAGLDFYNHNLDTSREFYKNVVTTRSYDDRISTLEKVRKSGIKVCSGGIIGLGEDVGDRIGLLLQLASLEKQPESVPINMLVRIHGTPMADNEDVDPFDLIRTIAVARILMPRSYVRLSAGREQLSEQTQALCFMAGANSVFYGCKLLTTPNPDIHRDKILFRKLGFNVERGDNLPTERNGGELLYQPATE